MLPHEIHKITETRPEVPANVTLFLHSAHPHYHKFILVTLGKSTFLSLLFRVARKTTSSTHTVSVDVSVRHASSRGLHNV